MSSDSRPMDRPGLPEEPAKIRLLCACASSSFHVEINRYAGLTYSGGVHADESVCGSFLDHLHVRRGRSHAAPLQNHGWKRVNRLLNRTAKSTVNALANCFWKVSPSQVPVPCCVSEWYSVWYAATYHIVMSGGE